MANPPEVQFDKYDASGNEIHRYTLDGKQIPSVSAILKSCGMSNYGNISQKVLDNAAERGDEVHKACYYWDENDLDYDDLEPDIRSFVDGWIQFKKDFQFVPLFIEKPFAHQMDGMWYGMTPDRYGNSIHGPVVIDIKTTVKIEPHHKLQMAAYQEFFESTGGEPCKRFIVQLGANTYKPEECKERKDRRIFAAVLLATHWKLAEGVEL